MRHLAVDSAITMDRRLGAEWDSRADERIEATRRRHDELRERLLNPKVRINGRDETALARQIREKEEQRQRERDDEAAYAAYLQNVHDALKEEELHREELDRQDKRETLALWQKEAARKSEKKAAELREYHRIETHIGPSSAQRLDGDDLGRRDRRDLQHRQMRIWAQEQSEDRERRRQEEKALDDADNEMMRRYCAQAEEMAQAARAAQQKRLREMKEYNLLQAKSRSERESFDRTLSQEREKRELEQLEQTRHNQEEGYRSQLAPHRFRPDHFNGLRGPHLDAIRAEQEAQLQDRQLRREQDAQDERAYAREQRALQQMANHVSCAEQERRKEVARETMKYQLQQLEERRAREAAERREYKTVSGFTDDFFSNFGKSHR